MKYYKSNEVADIIGVTRRTIYNYMEDGELKAYKVGRDWLFKEEDINNFITKRSNRDKKEDK